MPAETATRHHATWERLTRESLWRQVDAEHNGRIIECLAPGGRLVVFDPQPNWIVKLCRRIVGHRDAECSARQARDLLRVRGWRIQRLDFTEAIGLPLSGGYVGREWIPPRPALCRAVVGLNRVLSAFLNAVGLGPVLLWRYRLVAVRDSA